MNARRYNRWRAAREGLAEKLSGEIDDIVLVQGRVEIGPALEAKIRDVFMSIDTDSSNDIDQVELVVAFRQMGIELTEAESKKMIEVRERARTRARRDTLAIPCVRPRGARIRDARVPGREEYASADPSSSSTHSLMMPHRTSIKIMTGSSANPSSPIA